MEFGWTPEEAAHRQRPVKEVASVRIPVGVRGAFPLYASADWSNPLPEITRACRVFDSARLEVTT